MAIFSPLPRAAKNFPPHARLPRLHDALKGRFPARVGACPADSRPFFASDSDAGRSPRVAAGYLHAPQFPAVPSAITLSSHHFMLSPTVESHGQPDLWSACPVALLPALSARPASAYEGVGPPSAKKRADSGAISGYSSVRELRRCGLRADYPSPVFTGIEPNGC